MIETFMGDGAAWFTVPAVMGTAFLLLQLIAGELGGDTGGDIDLDPGLHSEVAEVGILSLQSIAAFAMGGGWMGLAAYRLLDFGMSGATAVSIVCGFGIAWVMVFVLRRLYALQSSGNITLASVVGETGTVYVQIPPSGEGSGRVTLVVAGKQREYNAVHAGDDTIDSQTLVRVVEIDESSNHVTVARA